MAQLAELVHRGAIQITPSILKQVCKNLPMWKIEFAQVNPERFPHLNDQLQFLANVVEDFRDGVADEVPYFAAACATFALIYAHRKYDLIPDDVPDVGRADDSGVVRIVLIENERVLSAQAEKMGFRWSDITVAA